MGMVMKIYDGELKLFLLCDIPSESCQEKIANLIDRSFLSSDEMMAFHKERKQKGYVFNEFYPVEKDYYKAGKIYNIKIRSIDKKLMHFFKENLASIRTSEIQALTFNFHEFHMKHITKLYSRTPVICKFENGYWRSKYDIEAFEKRLKENALKKFRLFSNNEIDEDFSLFKKVEILNEFPIPIKYKNVKLLCDKIELEIEENPQAQMLAQIMFACGAAEMNARGFGFVNAKMI